MQDETKIVLAFPSPVLSSKLLMTVMCRLPCLFLKLLLPHCPWPASSIIMTNTSIIGFFHVSCIDSARRQAVPPPRDTPIHDGIPTQPSTSRVEEIMQAKSKPEMMPAPPTWQMYVTFPCLCQPRTHGRLDNVLAMNCLGEQGPVSNWDICRFLKRDNWELDGIIF
jgi:hypothetical protein